MKHESIIARIEATSVDRSDFKLFSSEDLMNKTSQAKAVEDIFLMFDSDAIGGLQTNSPRVKRAEVSIEMKRIDDIGIYI
jgi:hypothetical protein